MSVASAGGFTIRVPAAVSRVALGLCVGLLAALAWWLLWLTDATTHGILHVGRAGHAVSHASEWTMAGLFIAGWTVMTIAMMLPTTLPVLATVDGLARGRRDRVLLLVLVIVGYVGIWIVFGAAAYAAVLGVRLAGMAPPAHAASPAAPLLLVLAGVFQFTPLKHRCLEKCRSPLSFALSYWRGVRQRWQAFRLGMGHGVFCVGCCWALMLLMFVTGAAHVGWMLALAAVMAVEKNVSWGRRVSAPLGLSLVLAGLALLTWGPA